MLKSVSLWLAVTLTLIVPSQLEAEVVYSEAVDGELSTDSMAPSDLGLFTIGTNTVAGQVTDIGVEGANDTADVFTFEIGAGSKLDTIVLSSFTSTLPSQAIFIGLDSGDVFDLTKEQINDPFGPNVSLILGGTTVGVTDIGQDILDNLRLAGSSGIGVPFTTPLGAGKYSIYLQENRNPSNYLFSFNVSAVPEPSSVAILGLLGIGIAVRQSRKRKANQTAKAA